MYVQSRLAFSSFFKISEKATAGQEVKPDQFCIRWAQLVLSSSQLRNVKCNIWKLGCSKLKILFPNILTIHSLLKLLQIHGLTHNHLFLLTILRTSNLVCVQLEWLVSGLAWVTHNCSNQACWSKGTSLFTDLWLSASDKMQPLSTWSLILLRLVQAFPLQWVPEMQRRTLMRSLPQHSTEQSTRYKPKFQRR